MMSVLLSVLLTLRTWAALKLEILALRHGMRSLYLLTSSMRHAGGAWHDVDDWLSAEQELTHHYR
jgi:hypothetical protein